MDTVREKMKHIKTTGMIDRKCNTGRLREKMTEAQRIPIGNVTEILKVTKKKM